MKQTTNYDIYLDASGLVHCARCRITGKFIKRDVAQFEYDKEYAYNPTPWTGLLVMFVWWALSCLEQIKLKAEGTTQRRTMDEIEGLILHAYQVGDDAQLFKLYGERYKLQRVGV